MKNTKEQLMELNKETAMRLWNKLYGKATKVEDFTGRTIVKGAYNNRNSEFGWNVDHILPQSRGGKTADHNLLICHILTNDEKADKFPGFTANGIAFTIIKVENHYEIKRMNNDMDRALKNPEHNNMINFMDSTQGINFFKSLKGIQNKPRFVGTVLVRLKNVSNTAVIDFIERFFDEENISYSMESGYYNSETRIIARNYNMPLQEDISKLLDKCIVLNTYIKEYFMKKDYVASYDIYFNVEYFKAKESMYLESQKINFNNVKGNFDNTMFINELVCINTEAKEKVVGKNFEGILYNQYDYIYTNLSKNLNEEVSGK